MNADRSAPGDQPSSAATEQDLLDLLRPTLEWAVGYVRREKPATTPKTLRPVLRFTKLPASALRQTYRSIEGDAAFRAELGVKFSSAAPVDGPLGRLGSLWLERCDDWEPAFERAVRAEMRRLNAVRSVEAEDDFERRATAAELVAERERQDRSAAVDRAAEAEQVAHERNAALAAAQARIEELTGQLADREVAHTETIRQLKTAEALAQRRLDEFRALEAGRLEDLAQPAPAVRAEPELDTEALRNQLITMHAELAVSGSAIEAAQAALSDAFATLKPMAPSPMASPPAKLAPSASVTPSPNTRSGRTPAARRRKIAVPPGLNDETIEAAEHLIRTPDVVLLVDGYNQSMYQWAHTPIATQRDVMVSRLSTLAARTGASVDLVFDGDDPGRSATSKRARGIRVRFSPASVEADDVIIELCSTYDPSIPLLVASDDKRVRAGAASAGANLLTGQQLHGLLV